MASTPAPFRLSVLDQSPVSQGSPPARALANTLDLARAADRLGYHRYWVAEHHGGPMLAGPSPEALIGPIAAATARIRVGSGGVMLPHYSPLKVAETFSVLAGLFPGRIDLGLGRAAGTDPMTTFALQRDRRQAAPDDFPQQLTELLGYLDDTLPADHPFARLAKTLPGLPERPEPWLLGSSPQSALWAAELGLPYAFADFINPDGAQIAALYRQRYAEHQHTHPARTAVGVWVICADSDEEALRLAASGRMAFTLLRRGQLIAVPPPDQALRFLEVDERTRAGGAAGVGGGGGAGRGGGEHRSRRRAIAGAPARVRAQVEEVAASYGAQEVIVVCITYEHEARRRSYELLADAFALDGQATEGADTHGGRAEVGESLAQR
ncbi:MAG TPA: LLM class flavin-dependent oxidoreductase [Solirubrobacteraceae bacterium]|nr:LLM class flavin-dependent oxidoreductase [Solirubrobacteraceae bacterium]